MPHSNHPEKALRIFANILFILGIAMLWHAGTAPNPVRQIDSSHIRATILLLPGLTAIALGVVNGTHQRIGSRQLLLGGSLLLCFVVLFIQQQSDASPLALCDAIFDGMLFFGWISLSTMLRAIIFDTSIPLGFLLGSVLSILFKAGVPCLLGFTHTGSLAISFACLACAYSLFDFSRKQNQTVTHGRSELLSNNNSEPLESSSIPSAKTIILRYSVLFLGAIAFSFVLGIMTDAHGWMEPTKYESFAPATNCVVAGILCLGTIIYRKSFRIDVVIALAIPLFMAACLSSSNGANGMIYAREGIVAGYLVFLILSWIKMKREALLFQPWSTCVFSIVAGLLLAFVQIGRMVASIASTAGSLNAEGLSLLSMSLFWMLVLLAMGAFGLLRLHAVEQDLEDKQPSSTSGNCTLTDTEGADELLGFSTSSATNTHIKHTDPPAANYKNDQPPISSSVIVLDEMQRKINRFAKLTNLSERETEVLANFAQGRSAASISERLFISVNTVKTHLRRIYEKAGIHSRKELLDILEKL